MPLTESFENFRDNSLKGGLSNDVTLTPPLLSLVNTLKDDELQPEEMEEKDMEKEMEMEEKEMEREREENMEVEQRGEEGELPFRVPKPPFSNQQGFTCTCCLSTNDDTAYPFCVCCGVNVSCDEYLAF
jgi:hypothetical protein